MLHLSEQVREALDGGQAVVALESTVISHGLPYPTNLETARRTEEIVREHGGEIRVRSSQEWSVIFVVSLPIRTNEDRRQQPDRRGGRDRRRAA